MIASRVVPTRILAFDELTRPEAVVQVVKHGLQAEGARLDIDLAFDRQQHTRVDRGALVALQGRDRNGVGLGHCLTHEAKIFFRQGKENRNRPQLRNGGDNCAVSRLQIGADVNVTQTYASRDGSSDA